MSQTYSDTVETARSYYNSDDADLFYYTVWGGEDIHVGLYESDDESIRDASRRTVQRMAEMVGPINADMTVLDLGAGYGGAARYLAKTYGCKVVALNLSEVENQRDRDMNREQGLDHLITVLDASFDKVDYPDASFDIVWSQDAILHSDNREKVMAEAARVLKPGGKMVFTDPMQADDADTEKLQPIYDRIHLESLASPGFYQRVAKDLGLAVERFDDHTHQLARHYGRVLAELGRQETKVREAGVSNDYIERMKKGLEHWVNGGKAGQLAWGIFILRKPA